MPDEREKRAANPESQRSLIERWQQHCSPLYVRVCRGVGVKQGLEGSHDQFSFLPKGVLTKREREREREGAD